MTWERPRAGGGAPQRGVTDVANFASELEGVLRRVERVLSAPRGEFVDDAPSYDAASMAVIRVHAMTERSEYSPFFRALTAEEAAGIRAVRNIAVHRGYDRMDDAVLWGVVTQLLPPLLERLRLAAG